MAVAPTAIAPIAVAPAVVAPAAAAPAAISPVAVAMEPSAGNPRESTPARALASAGDAVLPALAPLGNGLEHKTLSRPKGPPKRPPSRSSSVEPSATAAEGGDAPAMQQAKPPEIKLNSSGLPILDKVDHSKNLTERERIAASVDVGATNARMEAVDFSFNFG